MGKTGALTKALAIAGVVLAWFPIAATVVTSTAGSLATGMFRGDYLMPAELFPAALAGGGLLLWAAARAHARQRLIGWGFAAMAALLFAALALPVVTGLASGETEPTGWPWVLVLTALAGYTLALVTTATAGILLLRDLFRGGDGLLKPV